MKNDISIKKMKREKIKLLNELASLNLAIRGSMLRRFSTCSRKNCSCHRGKKHGPRHYVSVTSNKRQKQHYVPQAQLDTVKEGVRQYHRMLEILNRLTVINLKLMRKGELNEHERK